MTVLVLSGEAAPRTSRRAVAADLVMQNLAELPRTWALPG